MSGHSRHGPVARGRLGAALLGLSLAVGAHSPEHPGAADDTGRNHLNRAHALQQRHEFTAALEALRLARAAGLDDPNLDLQQASLLRRLGRLDDARHACAALERAELRSLCTLPLDALDGRQAEAQAALAQLRLPSDATLQAWRDRELAAVLERAGDAAAARRLWLRSLTLDPHDHHARIQLSWNLLRAGRPRAVRELNPPGDADQPSRALLRLLAARQLDLSGWQEDARALQARLRHARRHGDVHDRELAWLALRLLDAPDAAAEAALRNWQLQREPEDALLLAEIAARTGDPRLYRVLDGLRAEQGYRDARWPALRGVILSEPRQSEVQL